MEKEQLVVKLKLDVIFKRVFGDEKNEAIIAQFIANLLEIPRESITKIVMDNVEMPPDTAGQKFGKLDLRMEVDGRMVNVELQVNREVDFKERTLFYWSKMYSADLEAGERYSSLKQTICINIINFNLFDCEDYHSNFKILENERHEVLTDKFAIHFFELRKLGKSRKNKPMEDWLDLINAETEDELMAIQQNTSIKEVKDTIVMLRHMSADEQLKRIAEYREKAMRDEASALRGEREEGREEKKREIIAKLRSKGFTDLQIKDMLDIETLD